MLTPSILLTSFFFSWFNNNFHWRSFENFDKTHKFFSRWLSVCRMICSSFTNGELLFAIDDQLIVFKYWPKKLKTWHLPRGGDDDSTLLYPRLSVNRRLRLGTGWEPPIRGSEMFERPPRPNLTDFLIFFCKKHMSHPFPWWICFWGVQKNRIEENLLSYLQRFSCCFTKHANNFQKKIIWRNVITIEF